MEEYKSNSHKSRERAKAELPEKKVEKIVSGSVKTKKKSGINKLAGIFVPEDVDNVKSYIFEDIVVPAVKDIILDAVKAVLELRALVVKDRPQAKYLIVNIMKTQHRATEEITIHRVLLVVAISMIFTLTPELRQKMYWLLWTKSLQVTEL